MREFNKISPRSKKLISVSAAGLITSFIFVFWAVNSMGGIGDSLSQASSQGASLFKFLDQKIEMTYNAFNDIRSRTISNGLTQPVITATSSSTQVSTSTDKI